MKYRRYYYCLFHQIWDAHENNPPISGASVPEKLKCPVQYSPFRPRWYFLTRISIYKYTPIQTLFSQFVNLTNHQHKIPEKTDLIVAIQWSKQQQQQQRMSDIALLVAEEFEKRKDLARGMAQFNSWVFSKASALGNMVREEAILLKDVAVRELEKPKSTLGLAAVDGVFSAWLINI